MSGGDDIARLKRRIGSILPMQLQGEAGLREGEVRWVSGREAFLWIPEKLEVGSRYKVRIDLREMGRTDDGTATVAEVHGTRKLRLRPGYLVVAARRLPDPNQRAYLKDLLERVGVHGEADSSLASPGPPVERAPLPSSETGPSVERSSVARPSHEPTEPSPAPSSTSPTPRAGRVRGRGARVERDRIELTPLGPPPKRRKGTSEERSKPPRAVGRLPLGKPPLPVAPAPATALIDLGPPASLFVPLEDVAKARGAIRGEPPEIQVWLTPDEALVEGLRPAVMLSLPGGRFLQVEGLISSCDRERAVLSFPDAEPAELFLSGACAHGVVPRCSRVYAPGRHRGGHVCLGAAGRGLCRGRAHLGES